MIILRNGNHSIVGDELVTFHVNSCLESGFVLLHWAAVWLRLRPYIRSSASTERVALQFTLTPLEGYGIFVLFQAVSRQIP